MLDPLKSDQHSPSGGQEKGKTTHLIVTDQLDGRRREEQFFIVTAQEESAPGCLLREVGNWVGRCRLAEGYDVSMAGTKGLPAKTRRKASRAFSPFLRAVET